MDLVDRIYGKHEVHHIIKYAQIYTRLFSHLGNRGAWLILGAELPGYTKFNYAKHVKRWNRMMREEDFVVESKDFTFRNFERMMYRNTSMMYRNTAGGGGGGEGFHHAPPIRTNFHLILYEMTDSSKIYTEDRRRMVHKKFMMKDL